MSTHEDRYSVSRRSAQFPALRLGRFAAFASVFVAALPRCAPAALGAGALAVLMSASPAQAEYIDAYKFLDAVKKKDGDTVEKALMDTNNRIVNSKDSSTGDTALHIVVARRDLTWLNYLVGKGADVNAHNDRDVTPLEIAVQLGLERWCPVPHRPACRD